MGAPIILTDPVLLIEDALPIESDTLGSSTMRKSDFPSIVMDNRLICDANGALRNLTLAEQNAANVKG